jgi:hypothetical protein
MYICIVLKEWMPIRGPNPLIAMVKPKASGIQRRASMNGRQ